MEALDLKTSPGELAWVLIRQSLLRAMHGMLGADRAQSQYRQGEPRHLRPAG